MLSSLLFARNRTVKNFKLKKKWRNIATTCRRKAIREYWSTVSTELGKNPRKYYDTFKPFLAKEKSSSRNKNVNIMTDGNRIETDQKKVAELIANYFSTMADVIGIGYEKSNECNFDSHESIAEIKKAVSKETKSFEFRRINQIEVKETLDKINASKSKCPSRFSPKILKLVSHSIVQSMAKILNTCINMRSWPTAWKRGE